MSDTLFGNIEYSDREEFNKAMAELTPDKAVVLLAAAAAKAQGLGIYTPEESEAVIKSIKTLTVNDKFVI